MYPLPFPLKILKIPNYDFLGGMTSVQTQTITVACSWLTMQIYSNIACYSLQSYNKCCGNDR